MKTAVVLRHARRRDRSDNQSHLSRAGIEQARAVGARFERFDLVVASPLPRAFETAVAMGFSVDVISPNIQELGEDLLRDVRWDAGFAAWAAAYEANRSVAAYVDFLASLLKGWLGRLPAAGSLLVVTHGGLVEAMAVGIAPGGDPAALGPVADYVEGFVATERAGGGYELGALRR